MDEYISRLKKFRNAEYLTRQMCLELIDAVTVDEFERASRSVIFTSITSLLIRAIRVSPTSKLWGYFMAG